MRRVITGLVSALAVLAVVTMPAQAILGGTPDGDAHPYVGMVYNDEYLCSGTLLSPRVFLTAGHCTQAFEEGTSQVYVTFAAQADFDPTHAVSGTPHTYPDFCIGCGSGLPGFDALDVGVVILDAPVDMATYGHLPKAGVVDTLPKGSPLTTVGYGVRGFKRGGGKPQPTDVAVRYRADVKLINVTERVGAMFVKTSGGAAKGGVASATRAGRCFSRTRPRL